MAKSTTLVLSGLALVAGAWLVWPTPYIYGNANGMVTRVNRLSGVIQYSSPKGWTTYSDAIHSHFAEFMPKPSGSGETAELVEAAQARRLRRVEVTESDMSAWYHNGERMIYSRPIPSELSDLTKALAREGVPVEHVGTSFPLGQTK